MPTPEAIAQSAADASSVADELRQEAERLQLLADKLKARESALAEMEESYPHVLQLAHERLREILKPSPEEALVDDNLEALAERLGAQPLEGFIDEIERAPEESE